MMLFIVSGQLHMYCLEQLHQLQGHLRSLSLHKKDK